MAVGLLGTSPAGAQSAPQPTPDDRILGKPDAPITIFEYASLTCPHCAEFDRETLPKLKESWIDTGKARLIFRDFPLDGTALKAAILARCSPPSEFYSFIDVLFRSQQSWAVSSDLNAALEKIAKLGGLSDETFNACMKNDDLQKQIVAERYQAEKQYGVDSTPTFFINGVKFVGAQPFSEFDKALQAASKS
ncbi:MAG TPA: DsbA family protein [Stellaceae bacterium]|nr:DsbA family protein [Stellaceae bacterium]